MYPTYRRCAVAELVSSPRRVLCRVAWRERRDHGQTREVPGAGCGATPFCGSRGFLRERRRAVGTLAFLVFGDPGGSQQARIAPR